MNVMKLISNKRIVLALGMIVAVAAIVISSTGAFFSDTETSTGNIFTAGAIDLTVDHLDQTYNGVDCETCSVNVYSSTATKVVDSNDAAVYQGPFPVQAVEITSPHPAWVNEASISPAQWIWLSGAVSPSDTTNNEEYTFEHTFNWNGAISGLNLDLALAADNGYKIVFNGTTITDQLGTEFNYGALVNTAAIEGPMAAEVQNGVNTLQITVRNKAGDANPANNPAGLLFKLNVQRPVEDCEADSDFQQMCELWEATNLDDQQFFNFNDIKPGDEGTNLISLHVTSNDAKVCALVHDVVDNGNGLTEPEDEDDSDADGLGEGELDDLLGFFVWQDNGNGTYEGGETIVAGPEASLQSISTGNYLNVAASSTAYLGVEWCAGTQTLVGTDVQCDGASESNISQTDSLEASLTLYAEQARNNENFTCSSELVEEEV